MQQKLSLPPPPAGRVPCVLGPSPPACGVGPRDDCRACGCALDECLYEHGGSASDTRVWDGRAKELLACESNGTQQVDSK
eukprot:39054-Prorocentrum_minimum.AAC.1